jgi:hypothetical protein
MAHAEQVLYEARDHRMGSAALRDEEHPRKAQKHFSVRLRRVGSRQFGRIAIEELSSK